MGICCNPLYQYDHFLDPNGLSGGGGGYVFTNAQAEAYYNGLVVANGGADIDAQTIYGITLNQLKEGIDNFFISGATDGWLTKMVALYLIIGATAATHAVNSVNVGTFTVTWVGSPTHAANGVTFNGTTQFGETGLSPSSNLTLNNTILTARFSLIVGGVRTILGSTNGITTAKFDINHSGTNSYVSDQYNNSTGRETILDSSDYDNFLTANRRAANDHVLTSDNGEESNTSGGGALPSASMYLGARNNSGTAGIFFNGSISMGGTGDSLSIAENTSFRNAITTLNTLLGR